MEPISALVGGGIVAGIAAVITAIYKGVVALRQAGADSEATLVKNLVAETVRLSEISQEDAKTIRDQRKEIGKLGEEVALYRAYIIGRGEVPPESRT